MLHAQLLTGKPAFVWLQSLIKFSIDIIVLNDESVIPFITPVSQEECYRLFMFYQEKYLHFQQKSQEMSGKMRS